MYTVHVDIENSFTCNAVPCIRHVRVNNKYVAIYSYKFTETSAGETIFVAYTISNIRKKEKE